MRFLIRLKSKDDKKIPINYQHALSSMVYKFMKEANPDLSSRLHHSRDFKYFNFSLLHSKNRIIDGNSILFPQDSTVIFNLSSPDSEILRSAVEGMFKTREIQLLGKISRWIRLSILIRLTFPFLLDSKPYLPFTSTL
ncbi:MAG: hypothetical protein ACXQTT_00375 [Candidatus Syntropharchaeia archaeon]